jgi:hypothetical protein
MTLRKRSGCGCGYGLAKVAACDLEDVGEEAGSFEVHAIVGEQGGEVAEGLLDGGATVEVGDVEGFVFDDGRDDGVSVGEAHEVVVHGSGAAAASVLVVVVHALVRDGWFAAEVVAVVQHGGGPPGLSGVVLLMLLGLGEGSHTLVNS